MSGTHLATWGGRGEGPGEISSDLTHVETWTADSIIAWYSGGGREVSLYDSEGRFGRSLRLARGDGFSSTRDVIADRTILATAYAGGDDLAVEIWNGDGTFQGARIVVVNPEGGFVRQLGGVGQGPGGFDQHNTTSIRIAVLSDGRVAAFDQRRLPEVLTRARQTHYGRNRKRTTYCSPNSSVVTPVTVPLPNTGKGFCSMGAGEATRPT